jgi:multidrug transporter EmrE-like cation transporter
VPAFAPLNIGSQWVTAAVMALTLGNLPSPANDHFFNQELITVISETPIKKLFCVMAGGFCLGHGDHIGAVAMEHIPGAIAYPCYSGIALAGGSLMNYAQEGSSNPGQLFGGLGLIGVGICLLAYVSVVRSAENSAAAVQPTMAVARTPENASASSTKEDEKDTLVVKEGDAPYGTVETGEGDGGGIKKLPQSTALFLCFIAGLCSASWSPLAAYGRLSDGYINQVFFCTGQLFAIPSVALIASYVNSVPMSDAFRELTVSRGLWGICCGIFVGSGFTCYFLATQVLNTNIVFGLAACNPLLSIVIEIIDGQFAGSSMRLKILLFLAVLVYGSAIYTLATLAASQEVSD